MKEGENQASLTNANRKPIFANDNMCIDLKLKHNIILLKIGSLDNAIQELSLSLIAIMVYEQLYHALQISQVYT